MALAAGNVIWGISAPTFLSGYLLLAVVVIGYAAVRRRQLLAGPESVRTSALTATQVGYLNGGSRLAICTALAALRNAGAVGIGPAPDRRLVVTGDRPVGAGGLEAAVHQFAGHRRPPRELDYDSGVSVELGRTHTGLIEAGLMPGEETRRALRRATRLLAGVLLLGVLRLFAEASAGDVWPPLIPVLVAVAVATVVLGRRPPVRTRAGGWALAALRTEHAHLAPSQQPAWSTYGPHGAALAVALFGPAALWAADPEFAAEAGLQQGVGVASGAVGGASATGSGGFACAGGYGSDSGSSDSGGGHGCGSGGGSSCGGGGGGCGGGGGGS
ncbi:TIGR04222 domain-containing membrane protein [Plantactinospora sp. WMMB782]|uniref:TIGR04222 domain-containing membrane protein n=1 Tax=Plantactinospora sp. WMMB782 TaxID=3404121 RepID=UPI003B9503BD